jgi:DUF1680 family protein
MPPVKVTEAGPVRLTSRARAAYRPVISARITGGFWGDWQQVNAATSIPGAWQRMHEAGNLLDLQLAAATATGHYRNDHPFMDTDVYKWLEAVSWLAQAGPVDAGLEDRAAEAVALLQAAQEDDGYLNSYFQVTQPGRRFADLHWGHELYTAGHLIQAAVARLRATGQADLLDIAIRMADLIDRSFGTAPGQIDLVDGHPGIETALVELYRTTGNRSYLARARYFLDRRGHGLLGPARRSPDTFGPQYWQDHVPFRDARTVEGHAVRQLYLMAGGADIYLETGDPDLLAACERLWDDMTTTKTYLTGGVGTHHLDEAFGDPYELPTERAYCETCAAIASIQLSWRLFLATGEPRYADLIERTLYNGFLAGVSLGGDAFSYVNPLQVRDGHQASGGDMDPARLAWFRCACCPPNMMRLLASLQHYAVASGSDQVAVTQYITGDYRASVADCELRLSVRSALPWSGDIGIEITQAPPVPVELRLRVPPWAGSAVAAVNGVPVTRPQAGGWITVPASWSPGDRVDLTFTLPVRLVSAHPRVDATRGDSAVERGPLVYCIESADLPAGQRLDDFELDRDAPAALVQAAGLPAGMTGLRLSGRSRPAQGRGWWPYQAPLSSPAIRQDATRLTVTAIPYFAHGNRQPGAMRVWFPPAAFAVNR